VLSGGELYREYRHDAVESKYDSIMLLLVRLIAAILHATHLSHAPAVAMTLDAEARLSSAATVCRNCNQLTIAQLIVQCLLDKLEIAS